MVIDDLADRAHDCDLLLDQNLGRSAADYAAHVPPACKMLIGPRYALLRPEFAALRPQSLARRAQPELKHLLITMGGVDKDNATSRVLEALRTCDLPQHCHITVVMGPHAPWLEEVRRLAATMPWATEVLVNIRDMAVLMAKSDVAIGAAGSTSWERCALGLPTVQLILADNQREAGAALAATGAVEILAATETFTTDLSYLIRHIKEGSARLKSLSERAAVICDGNGTATVSNYLLDLNVTIQENE